LAQCIENSFKGKCENLVHVTETAGKLRHFLRLVIVEPLTYSPYIFVGLSCNKVSDDI